MIPPIFRRWMTLFFANAKLRLPEGKVPVVMTVDADVFQWFKSQGADYQNLINTALRIYAEEHNP